MSVGQQKVLNVTNSVGNAGVESARWSAQLWKTIQAKMKNAYNVDLQAISIYNFSGVD